MLVLVPCAGRWGVGGKAQAAGSRGSKDLKQALVELDRERKDRSDEGAVRSKLEEEVAELTTTAESLKVSACPWISCQKSRGN